MHINQRKYQHVMDIIIIVNIFTVTAVTFNDTATFWTATLNLQEVWLPIDLVSYFRDI